MSHTAHNSKAMSHTAHNSKALSHTVHYIEAVKSLLFLTQTLTASALVCTHYVTSRHSH
jgi:hypothetical protein